MEKNIKNIKKKKKKEGLFLDYVSMSLKNLKARGGLA